MAGPRSENTLVEFLQGMLVDIAKAKLLPDADQGFLQLLEGQIIGRAKAAFEGQPGMPGLPGAGNPGTPPGVPPGASAGGPSPAMGLGQLLAGLGGPGQPGSMPMGGAPPLPPQANMEQLSRLMRGTT